MNNNLLKSLGISDSDMLHRVIGTTFIVEYGIIKKIPATGIVTVEMAVADSADDIIITNCVLASFASSSVTVNIKPNIDDKVIGMVIAITLLKSSNAFADRNLAVKCNEKD